MKGELLLGIDVGTYTPKGVLVTPAGEVVRQAVVEHGMDVPQPGWAEHDADGIWWNDVVVLCHRLLDGDSHQGDDVAGVAVSAIGPSLLPLDEGGRPLRPDILYGVGRGGVAQGTSRARGGRAMTYGGYSAKVTFDPDAEVLQGEVVGSRDVITF